MNNVSVGSSRRTFPTRSCRYRRWSYTVDQAETDRLRARVRAGRGPLPMFSRGPYFEQMKRDDKIVRPAGYDDPDDGWFAGEVMPEAAE